MNRPANIAPRFARALAYAIAMVISFAGPSFLLAGGFTLSFHGNSPGSLSRPGSFDAGLPEHYYVLASAAATSASEIEHRQSALAFLNNLEMRLEISIQEKTLAEEAWQPAPSPRANPRQRLNSRSMPDQSVTDGNGLITTANLRLALSVAANAQHSTQVRDTPGSMTRSAPEAFRQNDYHSIRNGYIRRAGSAHANFQFASFRSRLLFYNPGASPHKARTQPFKTPRFAFASAPAPVPVPRPRLRAPHQSLTTRGIDHALFPA